MNLLEQLAMPELIAATAAELGRFFTPLTVALEDEDELALFLRRFGISLQATLLTGPLGTLTPLRDGVRAISLAAQDAAAHGLQQSDITALFEAARSLFDGSKTIPSTLSGLVPDGMTQQAFAQLLPSLAEELLDLLLADYLKEKVPLVAALLNLLDVYRPETIPPAGHPASRGLAYTRHTFDWSRIPLLFDDPESWARAAYDWGVSLDSDKLVWRLSRVIELIGAVVLVEEMTPAVVAAFMPDWPNRTSPPKMARAPLIRKNVVGDDGSFDAAASGEAGIALFPVSGKSPPSGPTDRGIAAGPYLEGQAGVSADFGDGFSAQVNGSLAAVGCIVFAVRPSGIEVATGIDATAFSGAFTLELTKRPLGGAATVTLVGQPGSSRVEVQSLTAAFGGEISNTGHDLYVAAGAKALKVVLDPSGDGFLSMLLSGPLEIAAGDLLAGWRAGRGIYFEGGSNLAVTIPVNKTIGPFKLYKIGLNIDLVDNPSVTGMVTADARLGPLYAFVDGLGLTVTLVPNQHGALGKYDLAFGLKLPTGYAVALDASGISGGGFLAVADTDYRGALALKFEKFGFSAFAILDTVLPGGQPGFSFVASIFGDFVIPLGYGFFLTGLGGLIGINRTTNTQALRDVLYAGALDSILFPADPIANAATILDNTAAIFPARSGQYVFGPMARIAFGQPAVIEGKIGVVVELGAELRVLILGALATQLPTKDAPLVSLSLSFFGDIEFAAQTISFDATLQNSRVLTYAVSGDIAARTGWAPRIEHIVAYGGLHPQYPRPANLPDLRPLAINFGTDNPRVTVTAYHALTLNSLQFGARGELYAKGPKVPFVGRLAAEGNAYFDALIYFNPFAFDAALGGSLSLLVDDEVVMGLGFDLHMSGPNVFVIDGRVWATVFGIDVGFSIHHSWGVARAIEDALADAVALLTAALTDAPVLEGVGAAAFSNGVRFAEPPPGEDRRALSPAGGARFVQRALPLGAVIEKIGEATLTGAANTFDLQPSIPGQTATPPSAMLDFVRGHFWSLSEGERLRAAGFESHRAGFEIAADTLLVDASAAITGDYDYEVVVIGDDETVAPAIRPAGLDVATLAGWISAAHRERTAPLDAITLLAGRRADAIMLRTPAYVVMAAGGGVSAPFTTFNAARLAAFAGGGPVMANPVVNRYVAAAM
jgi:hypothetical protein